MIGDAPVDPFFIEAASVGLIAFAALALVGLFWERISQWRGVDDISAWTAVRLTSKRTKNAAQGRVFKEMSHEIRAARDRFVKLSEEVKLGFSMHHLRVNADIVDIGIKLSSIDLSVPSKVDLTDPKAALIWWREYLTFLTPLAELGQIEKAKAIKINNDGFDLALGAQE